jgi:hypothetical protein
VAGYLCAAFMGATFEVWMQWAAETGPDPVPYFGSGCRGAAGALTMTGNNCKGQSRVNRSPRSCHLSLRAPSAPTDSSRA